jgi:hypothetical protein
LPPLPDLDSTESVVAWILVQPKHGESCRWESADGRWIALTLGKGAELGRVVVADSDGRRVLVKSYETALATAKSWRD